MKHKIWVYVESHIVDQYTCKMYNELIKLIKPWLTYHSFGYHANGSYFGYNLYTNIFNRVCKKLALEGGNLDCTSRYFSHS